jgi:hypothetical protein
VGCAAKTYILTAVIVLLNLRFSIHPLYIDWVGLDDVGAVHGMDGGSGRQRAEMSEGR